MGKEVKKFDIYFSVNDFKEINIITVKDNSFYTLYDIDKEILNEIEFELENPDYKMGLYSAKLVCETYQCNHYLDPIEYDVRFSLEDIKIEHYL